MVIAHGSVGRYERALDLLEKRLTLAKELNSRREELRSFEVYAQLYEQMGDLPTARNFYERAVILARNLDENKLEVQLLDKMRQIQGKVAARSKKKR